MLHTVEEDRAWYNALPSKRISAAMVLRRGDSVLMVKANYKREWTFPGGVVDPDESPMVAAIRETHEEVGLTLNPSDVSMLSVGYIPQRHGFLDRIHFFFVSNNIPENTLKLAADEIDEATWVPLSEIAQRADDRSSYRAVQEMLVSGQIVPYFDAV